jgi:hypothetical protein
MDKHLLVILIDLPAVVRRATTVCKAGLSQ